MIINFTKKAVALVVALITAFTFGFSVFAEGEAELLDRNRNQGTGNRSYADIISEATADITFEEQEKVVKNIEICSDEYELVYEYYLDDVYFWGEKEYAELVASSRQTVIYVPVTGEVDGTRKLVGQICIHCQDGEVTEVKPEFSQIFDDGRVAVFQYDFLEQRTLLNEITAACEEKGATQITDAFFMYIREDRFITKAMLIESDIGTLVYEFGYNDYFDYFCVYTIEEFVTFCDENAESKWTFWDAMGWAGYLPIIIPGVVLLLAGVAVVAILTIKKHRKMMKRAA